MNATDEVPTPGSIIAGKYEVERVLGAGGMGVVVAARHVQLGQRVAIKFLRASALGDPASAARFLREAQAAVALTSDHVTKVLDVGVLPSGAPFMVMEHLAGVDLAEHLQRSGPMAIADAIDALLQACEAIAEAHARGIIHRDLKPSNLFVSRRIDGAPFVKVLDFGISKTSGPGGVGAGGGGLTATGLAMGSPSYMSPEQIRNAKAADPRSDVWSMGVILYQLLTGVAPFAGETIGETFARIISEDPVPVRQLRPEVPEGLAATIAQCLERPIERRLQTVAQLAMQIAPFGAADAAIAAQRVVHVSRSAGAAPAGGETLAAPSPARGSGTNEASSASRPPSAWQQSGTSPAPPRPPARAAWAVLVAGTLIAIVAVAIGARWRHHADPELTPTPTRAAAAQALPEAVVASTTTLSVVEVPALEEAIPDAGKVQTLSARDAGARQHEPRQPVTSTATVTSTITSTVTSTATATAVTRPPPKPPPKPDCDPSYTLDDTGQKHFKPECFR